MSRKRSGGLMLKVTVPGKCPVYNRGDIVIAQGRRIHNRHGTTCAHHVAGMLAVLEAHERGEDIFQVAGSLKDGTWICPATDCKTCFQVDFISAGEIEAMEKARIVATGAHDALPPAAASEANRTPRQPRRESLTQEIRRVESMDTTDRMRLNDASLPFIKRLPLEMARLLLQSGHARVFKPGTNLLVEGQVGKELYIITQGTAKVIKTMKDGSEMELARLERGECVGEMSLLSGEHCNAFVRAHDEVHSMAIAQGTLDDLLSRNPPLHRAFSHLFMARMKATNIRLEEELARGMTGKLSMISLLEILQTLMMSQQTGTLLIKSRDTRAVIYLDKGQATMCLCNTLEGEEAFFACVKLTEGTFSFQEKARDNIEVNIHRATMQLMMDSARVLDEG